MAGQTQLGDYNLLKEIGQGSYARVFKASSNVGEVVALKIVLSSKLDDHMKQNLANEVLIMSSFRHPNLCFLFKKFDSGRFTVLATEYCSGGDLAHFIRQRGCLREQESLNFLLQILNGLIFLAEVAVIHRDLKPANILLADKSNRPTLKLCDFGYAKVLQELAMCETPCGTPYYMAPEVLAMQDYNASADVWSLGVVFFEMLAGHPPFRGASPRELLENVRAGKWSAGSEERIGAGSAELLQSMLRADPSCRSTLTELHAVCQGQLKVAIEGEGEGAGEADGSREGVGEEEGEEEGEGDLLASLSAGVGARLSPPLASLRHLVASGQAPPRAGAEGNGSGLGSGSEQGLGSKASPENLLSDLHLGPPPSPSPSPPCHQHQGPSAPRPAPSCISTSASTSTGGSTSGSRRASSASSSSASLAALSLISSASASASASPHSSGRHHHHHHDASTHSSSSSAPAAAGGAGGDPLSALGTMFRRVMDQVFSNPFASRHPSLYAKPSPRPQGASSGRARSGSGGSSDWATSTPFSSRSSSSLARDRQGQGQGQGGLRSRGRSLADEDFVLVETEADAPPLPSPLPLPLPLPLTLPLHLKQQSGGDQEKLIPSNHSNHLDGEETKEEDGEKNQLDE